MSDRTRSPTGPDRIIPPLASLAAGSDRSSRQRGGSYAPAAVLPSPGYSWLSISAGGLMLACASLLVALCPASSIPNSDSLIPIFVSLESWSLFYWGQDRFGMLIPLLSLPVRDGFWNLIVQNALNVALLLSGSACLFARCGVRRPTLWALTFLAVLLWLDGGHISLLLLTTNQSYAPALGLFGIAVYLCRTGTWVPPILATVLMVLGAWTNAGVALLALCVLSCLLVIRGARAVCIPVLSGTVVALGVHELLQVFAPGPLIDVTHLRTVVYQDVPSQVARFWMGGVRSIGAPYWLAMAALWIPLLLLSRRHRLDARDWQWMLAVAAAVACYGSGMAVFFNGLPRHVAPVIAVLAITPLIVLGRHVPAGMGRRAFPIVVAGAILVQTGVTSPRQVRRNVIAQLGDSRAGELFVRNVEVVTGDYWSVYPLVFATNLLHEAVDGRRPVLPVALRSERLVIQRQGQLTPGTPVAIVPPEDVSYWLAQPHLPPLGTLVAAGDFTLTHVAGDTSGPAPR